MSATNRKPLELNAVLISLLGTDDVKGVNIKLQERATGGTRIELSGPVEATFTAGGITRDVGEEQVTITEGDFTFNYTGGQVVDFKPVPAAPKKAARSPARGETTGTPARAGCATARRLTLD